MDNPHYREDFQSRHIGPRESDIRDMLNTLGLPTLEALVEETIPEAIRQTDESLTRLPQPQHEYALLNELKLRAGKNRLFRSYIGMGYHNTITPGVIQRNVLENPGWYTQYTPYQAEISQGRLEALLNFQTMVMDLTGMEIANASLLDEGTAAAEAMLLFFNLGTAKDRNTFFVASDCHPQTIDVLRTRAKPLGIDLVLGDHDSFTPDENVFGVLLQYPATDGAIHNYSELCAAAHKKGAYVAVAADLLSLTLLKPPGEFGADVAIGNTQRFGVPLGYGGPHAAYFATSEKLKRKVPGRIIGVSQDSQGKRALRMALQTREQHIRRERATSNICTAQVLLAIMAGMYAVYHGPSGLKRIAQRIHGFTKKLANSITDLGHEVIHDQYFDTLRVRPKNISADLCRSRAEARETNFRYYEDGTVGISLDETTVLDDLRTLVEIFSNQDSKTEFLDSDTTLTYEGPLKRTSLYLQHPTFNSHHSETEMLRYLHRLEGKDLSLNTSMIPLGSCTMKLNGTTEMAAVSWPEFSAIHPFVPLDQTLGYQEIIRDLESWLKTITGFPAISMQPNSGAQGEYTGLLVIRAYHHSRGDHHRDVCLIPSSAHGTNPASSVMAGMKVVVVQCDEQGNIDVKDLKSKAELHSERLGAMMITYPSTHGVFEEEITDICRIVHSHGGQVYMDGANLNALVGLCRPADFGADVIHINLHKTFSIPHGGGGPGMGPICVTDQLADFLPSHPIIPTGGKQGITAVSSAPWGSPSILIISWAYVALMGAQGLTKASQVAILNANYMASKLSRHFKILYSGLQGRVAHEFILDLRPIRKSTGITDEDVAKRLMDYGFHAPTMSFPVPGTLMVEPTESESREELDRYCEALIRIKREIEDIQSGKSDPQDNALKNAPHTAPVTTADQWTHPYSREMAAYPAPWTREQKFWPPVGRVDNAYGDRNLVCSCPPIEEYQET